MGQSPEKLALKKEGECGGRGKEFFCISSDARVYPRKRLNWMRESTRNRGGQESNGKS